MKLRPVLTLLGYAIFFLVVLFAAAKCADATVYNFSLGDCATEEWGGSFCYENTVSPPLGSQNCSDATPHCDDNTDCTDGDYSICSGSDTDYYPQGNVTANYATIGFLACHSTETALLVRKGANGFQTATPAVICWDTSVLPDADTVTEALAVFYIDQVDNDGARNLIADWFSDDGTCDAGGAEWTKTISGTAFTYPLSAISLNNQNAIPLLLPNSVSKTGLTCLRIGIDGVAVGAGEDNRVDIQSYNSLLKPGPLLFLNESGPSPTPANTATFTLTPTVTQTFTRTPTITNTPTSVNTATSTHTPTATNTAVNTASPTNTNTPTTSRTPTGTTTALSTFTVSPTNGSPTPTLSSGCSHQTINEIPVRQSNFLTTTQNFLCDEDVERYAIQFWSFVVMGADQQANGGSLELSPMKAFVDGGYIQEPASLVGTTTIDLSSHLSQTCWVVASKLVTGNIVPFTRVPGTHYLLHCSGTKPLPLSLSLMWVAAVEMDGGGNVDTITDLRGWSPSVRTVETSTELNQLLDFRKSQFGYALDTGTLYFFVEDSPMTLAEWRVVATASEAVLLTGNQNITSGVKTFYEFPKKAGSLSPVDLDDFATKSYVDNNMGFDGTVTYDPPNLSPGESVSVLVSVVGASVTFGVCLASHSGFDEIYPAYVGVTAYPIAGNGVLVSITNIAGSVSINIPNGTVRVRCVNVNF